MSSASIHIPNMLTDQNLAMQAIVIVSLWAGIGYNTVLFNAALDMVREDYDNDQVRAVMMIEIVGKSTADVIRKLRGLPEIHTIHSTNGNWDLIAEIHSGSLSEFDNVLRKVRMIDGILNSETNLLLSSV
ncbi:Lrp/AsnC ligand binding domain-containing protein [Maritalea sp.]|uniref:Lrp/AsnC ligand binding domain-containing protein n=1 Tax=Maritalea sp. TaxID=2003361 RepID=UPI003EF4B1B5